MILFYKNKYYIIILILCITSFTHLFNTTGFPSIHVDEGTYMYRAMHLLTFGNLDWNNAFYDHPYFGPIFLASVFYIINFPNILNPDIQNYSSLELSYMIPRLIMGFLAIADTIFIYKITKIQYNHNAAIISSLLFSVMPLTWAMRRIYLESILYPFVLSSILIVIYLGKVRDIRPKKVNLLIFASGVLLGLSIFTKAPLIAMMPLLIFYIYSYKRKLTQVIIFLIPLIVIPLLWPIDAVYKGEFNQWMIGIISQLERQNDSILNALFDVYLIDPILVSMGLIGIIFAVFKRDYFLILWSVPFLVIFGFFISYINWFHLMPIFGFFCIGSGVMLDWIIKHIPRYKMIPFLMIGIFMASGLFATLTLISTDVSSFQFQVMYHINTILSKTTEPQTSNLIKTTTSSLLPITPEGEEKGPRVKVSEEIKDNNSTVIISSPIYSWIYKFVYKYNNTLYSYTENRDIKEENKVILVLDRYFRDFLVNNVELRNNTWNKELATSDDLYNAFIGLNSTEIFNGIARNYDLEQYPYTSMRFNLGGSPVVIRTDL